MSVAASTATSSLQSIVPWLPIITALLSLGGVGFTLYVTGRRAQADRDRDDRKRKEDSDRADQRLAAEAQARRDATRSLIIGVARVVDDRLYIQTQLGGNPIEGYAPYERFLTVAYSSDVVALVAHDRLNAEYFEALAIWEQAVGALRYGLERVAVLAAEKSTIFMIESERTNAIAAAEGALGATKTIRSLFGDTEDLKRYEFELRDLAHSVRHARLQELEIERVTQIARDANRSAPPDGQA